MINQLKMTVAALIRRPEDGAIYLQQRRWDCKVLPGAWDVVGGKVEEGESELQALEREIFEETGWQLTRIISELGMDEYDLQGDRWIDKSFLVEVNMNEAEQRIERDKYTHARWFLTQEEIQSFLQVNHFLGYGEHIYNIATRALSESHALSENIREISVSNRSLYPLQLAIIGAGGKQAAEFLTHYSRGKVIAAVDIDIEARHRTEKMGLQTFASISEMFEKSKINVEVAYLAVPHEYHTELAIQLLSKGISVLKEKPFAVTSKEARELFQIASEKSTPVFTTAHRPFRLIGRQLKSSLHLLGQVYAYTYEYSLSIPGRTSGWRSKWTSARGGVMLDMAYHQLDFIVWLLGEQKIESAQIAYCYGETEAEQLEDTSTILTSSISGNGTGRIITNRHAHQKIELLTLYGSKGIAVMSDSILHVFDRQGNLRWEVREPQGGQWTIKTMHQEYLSNRNNPLYWLPHMERHMHIVDCLTEAYAITFGITNTKEQTHV
ncbi:putative oxidoreductase [Xenorhabdus eapokensis]|uniref:Putative oxidoreductase n=2 Tax=Xenorhabdus eapokensis TaxID=1873482 RepID=A0A1Q5TGJ7_9GAMM|nr:putative oxidoreductase [Xenorhabdus eapokensis]